ncbi:beta-ketoacyl-ACP synthase III [Myroides sp. LJL119]
MSNKNTFANITAIGGYVPSNKRTNSDLEKITDTTDQWIQKRTGIKERRILDKKLATSDMAVEAINNMVQAYNKDLKSIDALIIATSTPDMPMPSTANIVCQKLDLQGPWAFDINAACSGFLYALDLAASLIESKRYKNIVVVGADKISSYVDLHDRSTNILFGDGAGAVWLEPNQDSGIIDALLISNGLGQEFLNIQAGGSLYPSSEIQEHQMNPFIQQDGKVVFKQAVTNMAHACNTILQKNNISIDQVDYLVPHQANKRIIDAVGNQIGIEPNKALTNISHLGNTIAATIPLCLWEHKNQLKKGDTLLLTAFGAGFSWGASLLTWNL